MSKKEDAHSVMDGSSRGSSSVYLNRALNAGGSQGGAGGKKALTRFYEMPIDDITPRPINNFRQYQIEELADTIHRDHDILLHPITIIKPSFLAEDSDVIKAFKEKDVDISSVKYMIVSGERRYHAWQLLRKREAEEIAKSGANRNNKFDNIPVKELTSDDAVIEELLYEDANSSARELSPLEGLLHIKKVIDEVVSPDEKAAAVREMKEAGYDGYAEMDIPKDVYKAERKFNQAKFCHYHLTKELKVENWSLKQVEYDLCILNKCIPEIVEAILKEGFKTGNARPLTALKPEDQKRLLDIWREDGLDAFNSELDKIKNKGQTEKKKEITKSVAKKKLKSLIKQIEKYQKEFEQMTGEISKSGKEYTAEIARVIKKCKEGLEQIDQ